MSSLEHDGIRTAEVIGCLCLATDLAIGLPFEHGLQSTLVAMRLADRLGVDAEVATETFYGCLLFYAGCTTDADVAAAMFPEGALLQHFNPVMYGSRAQTHARSPARAGRPGSIAPGSGDPGCCSPAAEPLVGTSEHIVAMCEVAEMLSDRLGVPGQVRDHFRGFTATVGRQGDSAGVGGEQIPMAVRIVQVARDATLQLLIGGRDHAAGVIRERAGKAFDPEVVTALLADDGGSARLHRAQGRCGPRCFGRNRSQRCWSERSSTEALAAMGDFADLISPYFLGHSAGVAQLADDAATRLWD